MKRRIFWQRTSRKIYFLTAPAIAPPRKAMIARYKVITIYRKNSVPTAGI
jgi:hypothetical protein